MVRGGVEECGRLTVLSHGPLYQRIWFVANGDTVTRSPSDIFCFLSVVRFPYEISCLLALVQNTVVIK